MSKDILTFGERQTIQINRLYKLVFDNPKNKERYFSENTALEKYRQIENKFKKDLYGLPMYFQTIAEREEKAMNKFLKNKVIGNGGQKYLDEKYKDEKPELPKLLEIFNEEVKSLLIQESYEEESDYTIELNYSNRKYFTQYGNNVKQIILYNKTVSKETEMIGTFFTITLPSMFHPFKTTKHGKRLKSKDWSLNLDYGFSTLLEGYRQGYEYINLVLKSFRERIKWNNKNIREDAKQIKFDFILEPHKTYQVHSHGIIFHPELLTEWIKECWDRTLEEYGLNEKACEIKQLFEGGADGATKYLLKYIMKNLQMDKDYNGENLDEMDIKISDLNKMHETAEDDNDMSSDDKNVAMEIYLGWKKSIGKARLHQYTRVPLGTKNYTDLYRSLMKEPKLREKLIEEATENGTCLMYELSKIVFFKEDTFEDGELVKTKRFGDTGIEDKYFYIFKKVYKERKKRMIKINERDPERRRIVKGIDITKEEYIEGTKQSKALINKGRAEHKFNNSLKENESDIRKENQKLLIERSNIMLKEFDTISKELDIFKVISYVPEVNEIKKIDDTLQENENRIKSLEGQVMEYETGMSLLLSEIKELKKIIIVNNPDDLDSLNEIIKREKKLIKRISIIKRKYFTYYKVSSKVIYNFEGELLYSKEWTNLGYTPDLTFEQNLLQSIEQIKKENHE